MPLAPTQDEGHRLAVPFSAQMNLGAEAATRPAQGFLVLTAPCTCRTLMGSNDRAIDKVHGPIQLTVSVPLTLQ